MPPVIASLTVVRKHVPTTTGKVMGLPQASLTCTVTLGQPAKLAEADVIGAMKKHLGGTAGVATHAPIVQLVLLFTVTVQHAN